MGHGLYADVTFTFYKTRRDKLKEETEKEIKIEIEINYTRQPHLTQFINTLQLME